MNPMQFLRIAACFVVSSCALVSAQDLKPLAKIEKTPSEELVSLGKRLFFDPRLSGDATISCSSCHDPGKAFTDGLAMSNGYPGSKYFRNTPTLLNVSDQEYFYWDGRMSGDDLPSLVRDHIAEAHFMQADGRLLIERMRQIPYYERTFKEVAGGEPSYGKILNAITAFVISLRSSETPFDRFLNGEKDAMSESAQRGLSLFKGKAGCINCHHGSSLTDNRFHATGVPTNQEIFSDPRRHITFRRFLRTIGIGQCATLRKDIGLRCVTKNPDDEGKFRTPSLREVSRTAPYMHNGSLPSLEAVVDFYDHGGGNTDVLKSLQLTTDEKKELVAFLKQLSSKPSSMVAPELPEYQLRALGDF